MTGSASATILCLMIAVGAQGGIVRPADAPAHAVVDLAALVDRWLIPPVVASGTRLPSPAGTIVRWRADRTGLRDGVVINGTGRPLDLHLTGTVTLPGGRTATKRFAVKVLGRDGRTLVAYTRVPTGAHDANQPSIARSAHLALGPVAGTATPLNGNYGTVFAKGDYVGVDRVALRGIADPAPFHFADGTLGLIGTRVDLSGRPDSTRSSAALVFKASSRQPAEFAELGLVDLRTADGVNAPRAVWDGTRRRYVVTWRDNRGEARWTPVADLARTEAVATPFYPANGGRRPRIVSAGNVGVPRAGAPVTIGPVDVAGFAGRHPDATGAAALAIDAATAAALERRFGRIVSVGAHVPPVGIVAGDVAALAGARARIAYSDGSTATRPVDWDPADLRRLAATRSGSVVVRGRIRQRVYPPIFAYNRADPAIYRYRRDGRTRYLFVATDDTGNNNVASTHLPLRIADSIADLADANGGRTREVDLLDRRTRQDRTAEGRTIAGCYWAPELHEMAGRLTILFAPCFNPRDDRSPDGGAWYTVEAHAMQLKDGGDPADPADWSPPAAVRRADGTKLGRPGFAANISLDMSYVELGARSYYTWSQRHRDPTRGTGDPLTWIARVDPAAPTRLASEPRPIIAPERSFEDNLAEGAFAISHDGRVHLVYSGSSVSPTYLVGGVWADAAADPTDIDAWHTWSAPLQRSVPMPAGVTDYLTYEQGPGHGSFTTDEDGTALYVYHTWGNGVGGNGRDTRVRRLHWAADGRPVLDMTPDEEVAPPLRAVTVTVTVTPRTRRSR